MIDKLKRLSYSSLRLLNENQLKRFSQYIKWERDNEYKSYFAVGKAFHLICEQYNKTGKKDSKIGYDYLYNECAKFNYTEPLFKEEAQLSALFGNYFDGTEEKMEYAELEITTNQFEIPFMWILDGVNNWIVYDYKAVSSFVNEDTDKGIEKLIEYHIQWWIYMMLYKVYFWFYPTSCKFIEVKKSQASLKYYKKEAIIDMAKLKPERDSNDESLTKDKLIEKYKLIPVGKNIVEILYSDELISRCNDIILNAINVIKNMKEDVLTQPFNQDTVIKNLIGNK